MWIEIVKSVLPPGWPVDLAAVHAEFVRAAGPDADGRFLSHLVEKGILTADQAEAARRLAEAGAHAEPDALEATRPGLAALAISSQDAVEVTRVHPAGGALVDADATLTSHGDEATAPGLAPIPDARSRYATLGIVGEGGMGIVYLAKDQDLRRKVAYKQLRPRAAVDPNVVQRFLHEAQITAQLDHPNVVPVYALEVQPGGALAYTMKWVRGKTLRELVEQANACHRKGQPPDEDCSLPALLEHFLKVCDAMAFAHSKGVVHRDLKPANIMVGRYNEVYVMDWGIARLMGRADELGLDALVELPQAEAAAEEGLELTRVGQCLGTPRYMSPEQAAGKNQELDGASDQYTLGIILFELVTLKPAVSGGSTMEMLVAALQGRRSPLEHAWPGQRIPRELRAIIGRATALEPARRYANVEAMADDVRRYLRGEGVLARPDNPLQRVVRWTGHNRAATLSIVLVLLAASLVPFLWSEYRRKAEELAAADERRRISAFLTVVARQSHRIDSRFLQLEEALEGLAAAATAALTRGPETDDPVFFHEDYNTPGRAPPDYAASEYYRVDASADFPVAVRGPGVEPAAVLPKLRRLGPLRHFFRRSFLESATGGRVELGADQERRLLMEGGCAMDYEYLVLPEGVLYLYPGMGCTPQPYDPLVRPYYTLAAGKRGKHWGNPYVDSSTDTSGDDLVLPCATSMYDEKGTFLGVAVVEIIFNKIIRSLLALPQVPAVQETSLLDADGNLIVDSKDLDARFRNTDLSKGIPIEPFRIPEVVKGIAARRSGYVEVERDGRRALAAFFRLEVVGWYYVVEADAAGLQKEGDAGGE